MPFARENSHRGDAPSVPAPEALLIEQLARATSELRRREAAGGDTRDVRAVIGCLRNTLAEIAEQGSVPEVTDDDSKCGTGAGSSRSTPGFSWRIWARRESTWSPARFSWPTATGPGGRSRSPWSGSRSRRSGSAKPKALSFEPCRGSRLPGRLFTRKLPDEEVSGEGRGSRPHLVSSGLSAAIRDSGRGREFTSCSPRRLCLPESSLGKSQTFHSLCAFFFDVMH